MFEGVHHVSDKVLEVYQGFDMVLSCLPATGNRERCAYQPRLHGVIQRIWNLVEGASALAESDFDIAVVQLPPSLRAELSWAVRRSPYPFATVARDSKSLSRQVDAPVSRTRWPEQQSVV
jgi:hypothetical protein